MVHWGWTFRGSGGAWLRPRVGGSHWQASRRGPLAAKGLVPWAGGAGAASRSLGAVTSMCGSGSRLGWVWWGV